MLKRIMFLMIAASLFVGFSSPASARERDGDDRDKEYVWEVECKCKWLLELEYYHDGHKTDYKEYCYPGHFIEKDIEAPDKYKKIELEAKLYDYKYESETEDAERRFDGKFKVWHSNDDHCYFKSEVSKKSDHHHRR